MMLSLLFLSTSLFAATPAEIAIAAYEKQEPFTIRSSILEVVDHGSIIVLEDGSRWIVEPDDTSTTAAWLGPARVLIRKGPHPEAEYPYMMKNTWTKAIVSVKRHD